MNILIYIFLGEQEPVELTRLQAQLYALAADQDTFLAEPHAGKKSSLKYRTTLNKDTGYFTNYLIILYSF